MGDGGADLKVFMGFVCTCRFRQEMRQDVWIREFENVARVILISAEEEPEAARSTGKRREKDGVIGVEVILV